jgi:antitoxin ParD1/3/4
VPWARQVPVANLAISCQTVYRHTMTTMNISLPDDMKAFVDQQVQSRGYMSSSEYIRDLVRRAKDIDDFRALIQEGLDSEIPQTSDAEFFALLRAGIGKGQ